MSQAPRSSSNEIHRQARKYAGGTVAGRLTFAEHRSRQQLTELGMRIGQWHQRIQQQWMAIPIADDFAELENRTEARAQLPIVGGEQVVVGTGGRGSPRL